MQGRHYEIGADITRTGSPCSTRAKCASGSATIWPRRASSWRNLPRSSSATNSRSRPCAREIETLQPQSAEATRLEQVVLADQAQCEQELAQWQQRWDQFMRALAAPIRPPRSSAPASSSWRISWAGWRCAANASVSSRSSCAPQDPGAQLSELVDAGGAGARRATRSWPARRARPSSVRRRLRQEQRAAESRLEGARAEREKVRGELVALEAVQKAALSHNAPRAGEWLNSSGLAARERVAQQLDVAGGWERAVETALGDYLEAVCVERLEDVEAALDRLSAGSHRAGGTGRDRRIGLCRRIAGREDHQGTGGGRRAAGGRAGR